MLTYEWKKLLLYRKGIFLILAVLLLELSGLLLFTDPYDITLEDNRTVYESYLTQVDGPLTPEKCTFMEAEMGRLDQNRKELLKLISTFNAGNIPLEEYLPKFEAMSAVDANYTGFSKLYYQYIYVREMPNRYFLYTGGWEVLFGFQAPDYLLLILLVFLLVPVFCQEYGNQMDQILITQKRSARCQWQTKLLAAMLLTTLLAALIQLSQLVYCAVRFGLPSWDYPMQSVMTYGTSEKQLTLWQAYLLQFFMRELGFLYAALILLFFSVFFRKFQHALIAGLVVLPLPLLTTDAATFLRIPGPWAPTIGSIYLLGSAYDGSGYGSEPIMIFEEVSWQQLGLLLGAIGIISLLMLSYIRAKNINFHCEAPSKLKAALLVAVAVVSLSGCSTEAETVIYNIDQATSFEHDGALLTTEMDRDFRWMQLDTGETYNFPLDPFLDQTTRGGICMYHRDGKLYYMKDTGHIVNSNIESPVRYYALMELDLETMKESVYYAWNPDRTWFFGLLDRKVSIANIPRSYFFLHRSSIFYLHNNDLYEFNTVTGLSHLHTALENYTILSYDGENIYYADRYGCLVVKNLDSGRTETHSQIVAYRLLLAPEGIYYLNKLDSDSLYYWDMKSIKPVKLNNRTASALYWDENYLWIGATDQTTASGYKLYRMNHDGTNATGLDCPGFVHCLTTGSVLHMIDYTTGIKYSVNKETLLCVELSS